MRHREIELFAQGHQAGTWPHQVWTIIWSLQGSSATPASPMVQERKQMLRAFILAGVGGGGRGGDTDLEAWTQFPGTWRKTLRMGAEEVLARMSGLLPRKGLKQRISLLGAPHL